MARWQTRVSAAPGIGGGAPAIASSTLPVKVVRGNRSAASAGGGRWVTTTTGAPAGWLSPQPSVWSNSRRPADGPWVLDVTDAPAMRNVGSDSFGDGLGYAWATTS